MFANILSAEPENERVLFYRAIALEQSENLAEARVVLKKLAARPKSKCHDGPPCICCRKKRKLIQLKYKIEGSPIKKSLKLSLSLAPL